LTRLLLRASLRFYLRHPWQLALAIAGISLGVAVYVGISLANDSASRSFDAAADRLQGPLTHRLVPIDGDLDERIFSDLSQRYGIGAASPIVEGRVELALRRNRPLPLIGLDPLQTIGNFAAGSPGPGADVRLGRLLTEPNSVLLPRELAEENGIAAGDSLLLMVGDLQVEALVIGVIDTTPANGEGELAILTDIATAQEVLGKVGRLSRVDLQLAEGELARLAAALPNGATVLAIEAESGTFSQLSAAFRTNLTALALLALVVGMFLIYGTMTFAVLQRRATLGILRTLGVTHTEILVTVLIEALAIASVATALGLLLGQALAFGLVDLVLGTIDDLSFGQAARPMPASPWILAQGTALGLAATLVAAAKPALDAGRAAPAALLRRAVVERGARAGARRAAALAAPLLLASGLLLAFGPTDLYSGFAALFGVLAAGALLTPAATVLIMSAIERSIGSRLGLPARLAVRGVTASLSRTGVATAALAVAVATVNGVGLMISTFRGSLADWLDTTLIADVYIVDSGSNGARLASDADRGALLTIPGVEGATLSRVRSLPTNEHGSLNIRAVEPGSRGFGLELVQGMAGALEELAAGRGVVVSERLELIRGVGFGDDLRLPTPNGEQRWPVVGVFRDFNTSEPAVVLSLAAYRRSFGDAELSSIGLEVARSADAEEVAAAVRDLVGVDGALRVRSTAGLKDLSLQVFDRTFTVTEVLRVLAGIVAFLGILSALLALELERARELAVLRTIGFTPAGLSATLIGQTGLLGISAGLAAAPIGIVLAGLLVHVINRRSFGWSMEFVVTPGALAVGLGLAVSAALLAGAYPAWRASRTGLAAALREE
jgi:putative ABC transport system permease protein